ncbi:MAG: methionyl-tRNA formyltransferase [Gemmatimonadetes bacterium]|nr:methionyl-tRNA formyltransferase [Gemmatimonadota bacterium]MYA78792.1 methionyl-tRNA formyltransferase [Gemmatimonadota bacterium]MYG14950.1 methionyl-tRNA formyltransferase [Gemmatimonadota bacterium]MYH19709.1 methionyl-tRNA formyltransferase [Gemmatimonadota bacterium]MYK99089.1 methionyl-tRNA formyltransferase [Gemmatimonadota bacterium]
MRVVYMGTPAFAVPSLEALISRPEHEVAGVVTGPDRPKGRGLKTAPTPVKETALRHGIPLWQPEKLRNPGFLDALRSLDAGLFVVVAFRILPDELLAIPPGGTINLHPSLLPRYRGAAPIQWAVISGDEVTGVTTFLVERRVDTGDILCQETVPIGPEETAGELHDRLSRTGADLLLRTVDGVADGRITPRPQRGEASPAPRISREDGRIDWRLPARNIHNRIRGLNPIPMAFTTWRGQRLRIISSQPVRLEGEGGRPPGEIVSADERRGVTVQTGECGLRLDRVQPEGRSRIEGAEFVRGYRPAAGDLLGDS